MGHKPSAFTTAVPIKMNFLGSALGWYMPKLYFNKWLHLAYCVRIPCKADLV